MRKNVYTHLVARPPEVIWAFLSDLRNDAAWRREITSVELLSGEPSEAGSKYREKVIWEGLETELTLKVEESVPGSRLVVTTDDPQYSSRSVWTFEPHADGTIVTLTFSLDAKGVLQLTEPFVWNVISHWLERDLGTLEGHLAATKA